LSSTYVDQDLERVVYQERIRVLYAKGLVALIANLVNAAILVVVLWGDSISKARALAWLGAMSSVVAIRLVIWQRHRAADQLKYDALHWQRLWSIGTAVTGAIWGSAAIALFPPDSMLGQQVVLFVLGGMVAGASASMSTYVPAFLAFTVPALAPAVIRLMLEGDRGHLAMALFLFVFGVGMTSVARAGGRALAESVRLRLTLADRENFMSVVSHELRTPLGAMRLSNDLVGEALRKPTVDVARAQRAADMTARQLERMHRLVDDLLDVNSLSANRMRYDKEPVDLHTIIRDTLDQMAPQLASVRSDIVVTEDAGLRGNWDSHRIEQMLKNLIANALKYGAPPYSLTSRRVGDKAELIVKDSGAGIPQQHLGRVFEIFERLDVGTARAGLGLGLYIAERIVRAHDGSIRAESKPGAGASFIVELPLLEP
jgi:signal transduction histidine kinase